MRPDKQRASGVRSVCKRCDRKYQDAYYLANRDRLVAAAARRYREDGDKRLKNRAFHLKNRYGMTLEQYDELLRTQDGTCAICKQSCGTGQRLAVDHDHATGDVRGLLCKKCNRFIGVIESLDLPRYLDYLDRPRPRNRPPVT